MDNRELNFKGNDWNWCIKLSLILAKVSIQNPDIDINKEIRNIWLYKTPALFGNFIEEEPKTENEFRWYFIYVAIKDYPEFIRDIQEDVDDVKKALIRYINKVKSINILRRILEEIEKISDRDTQIHKKRSQVCLIR